jgi:hypothetical protein
MGIMLWPLTFIPRSMAMYVCMNETISFYKECKVNTAEGNGTGQSLLLYFLRFFLRQNASGQIQ